MLDFKDFQDSFNKVIMNSQGGADAEKMDSSELLGQWAEAKTSLANAYLDGKLIKNLGHVTAQLSSEQKETKFDNFIQECDWYSLDQRAIDFIRINEKSFWKNTVTRSNDPNLIGMKLTRALKNFIADKNKLDVIQTKISMLLQQVELSGDLCISVHPLDFLSSSENTYHWRSCHALDGEYRGGNLSYMVDSSTMICYIKGEEDTDQLPGFPIPWNNKKWRMLLEVNDHKDFMITGRQYPMDLGENILSILADRMLENREIWSDWSTYYVKAIPIPGQGEMDLKAKYIPMRGYLYRYNKVIKDGIGALNYNDLLLSSYYTPYYIYNKKGIAVPEITIGGEPACPCCGSTTVTSSEALMCDECTRRYTDEGNVCDCCGRWYSSSESLTFVDNYSYCGNVCDRCLATEFTQCERCGEYVLNGDIMVTDNDTYLCRDCWGESD